MMDLSLPGAFVSRHLCAETCAHPLIRSDLTGATKNDACAAAHLLHAVHDAFPRFASGGTLLPPLQQAKITVLQSVYHGDVANGTVKGLNTAYSRLLNTTAAVISAASRAKRSNDEMNSALLEGADIKRARRKDRFNFLVVYDYIHQTELSGYTLPDYCLLVEPDKSKRSQWQAGRHLFDLHGDELNLTCSPHLRRGTRHEIAQQFLDSETLRW